VIQFDCVTLFPQMFAAVADYGIARRAREEGKWSLATWNPRDFTTDSYRTVDDRPYGGGPGMVLMPGPVVEAIEEAVGQLGTAGRNSWGRTGYGGPCPPRGSHRYIFTVYALDTRLGLPEGAQKPRVQDALRGHVLDRAQLTGRYQRSSG